MQQNPADSIPQKKSPLTMNLWAAVSIGVGAMIGAGIFSIFGAAGAEAGNALWIAFGAAGLVALLNTYSYAKLGSAFPSNGGPAEFLLQGFGDGVQTGGFNILIWLGSIFSMALVSRGFGGYAASFLPGSPGGEWITYFAVGIIILFVIVNFWGAKAVGNSELTIVAIKVGILLLFGISGIFFIKPNLLSPALWPAESNILIATTLVFFSYLGFGYITNTAGDMADPKKMLPRALYLSVFISIGIYLLVSITVMGTLPFSEVLKAKDFALAEGAQPILGILGFKLIAIAALLSTSSAINATMYGAANTSYMMARDGELPPAFDRHIWKKAEGGLFITAGMTIMLAIAFPIEKIAMLGGVVYLLVYIAVNIAHLKVRAKTGANKITLLISILLNVSLIGIIFWYLFNTNTSILFSFIGLIFICFIFEWGYRKTTGRRIRSALSKPTGFSI
jgi:amino acid transporter